VDDNNVAEKGGNESHHERGRAIYNFRCYFCHGYSGDAKTLAASYLTPSPRSFINTEPASLSRKSMIQTITHGRSGTATQGFINTLSVQDIELVADFVRREFMENKATNTRYHTVENGWPNHEQYAPAFPFAQEEIAIDTPDHELTSVQQIGKRIFMQSCITCHDRARVNDEGVIWETRAVSFPRNQYSHRKGAHRKNEIEQDKKIDSETGASPYARHDKAPVIEQATVQIREGERLFQANCAFCHAADGTGKNWIGSFLEPHPRNLVDPANMETMTRDRLRKVIQEGLQDTTLPAWKSVINLKQIDSIIDYIDKAFYPIGG
jgi:cytochrome c oxidase cbb3-type subunit 3